MNPDEIRELMARRGWTQEALAAHVGVAQATVSRWLSGMHAPTNLALRELRRLASEPPQRSAA